VKGDEGPYSGRPVLVTGASKGIGRAVAIRLGAQGFPIIVHFGRDQAGGEATAEIIRQAGGTARLVSFDVADRAASRAAIEAIVAERACWGVCLCAGVTRDAPFPGLADDDWDDVLRTNLDGFYNVLRPLILPMVRRRDGGRVVALSSVSGVIGNRGQVNYSASKAGIIGAVKALAVELASRRITVNAVAPGLIDTQMTDGVPDEVVKSIPMGRIGQVEEVAGVVSFLFSDDASYVTRQVIGVNGGIC
jgi:3-oxoacyl-[acyl-carrier protein] reductase